MKQIVGSWRAALAFVALCVAGGAGFSAQADEVYRTEISVEFPINEWHIKPDFSENSKNLKAITDLLETVESDSTLIIDELSFYGAASPDGGNRINNPLSEKRMNALRSWVMEQTTLPDSIVTSRRSEVPWNTFREMLSKSDWQWAGRVLEVINEGNDSDAATVDRRLKNLRYMDAGRVWRVLCRDYFPRLRMAYVVFVNVRRVESEPAVEAVEAPKPEIIEQVPPAEPVEAAPAASTEPETESAPASCFGQWYLRTNLPAWGMAMTNISGEYQFACRWSVGLSLYYSAWNYAKVTRKFRLFSFRPEVRYYFRDGGNGLFLDAHLAMTSFNFAFNGGKWRYQDRGGKHPALGGGIGIGYRLPLSRDGRWRAEAAVGAGIYHLDYDKFHNRDNGSWASRVKCTYVGLDYASLSVVFTFNAAGRR